MRSAIDSLVLLAALKAIRMRCATRVREVEQEGVSPADYGVVVWGLPADATTEEIQVHFNRIALLDAKGAATTADIENGSPGAAAEEAAVGIDRDGGEVAAVHIARREGELLGEWRQLAESQVAFRRLRAAADRRRSPEGEKAGVTASEGATGTTGKGPGTASEPAVDRAAASRDPTETLVDKNLLALQLRIAKQEARVRQMLESRLAGQVVCAFVVRRVASLLACIMLRR